MKAQHRPLAAYRSISLAACILSFIAFLLLLLVGLSLPIIKAVYIIRIYSVTDAESTGIATELRFGVWGLCALNVDNEGECFGPKLGYTIPETYTSILGISDSIVDIVTSSLLAVLILHLIAAALSFVLMISSLFLASHAMSILSLLLSILSALFSTIMFAIDVGIVVIVKNELPQYVDDGLDVAFGNAVWMALGAMVATWAAVVLLSMRACYCLGVRKVSFSEIQKTG